jgi:hypothetical protein
MIEQDLEEKLIVFFCFVVCVFACVFISLCVVLSNHFKDDNTFPFC